MGRGYLNCQQIIRDTIRSRNKFQEGEHDVDQGNEDEDVVDDISEQTRSVSDRGSESPSPSITGSLSSTSISISRETIRLTAQYPDGTPNLEYVNSISRLYLLFHNIDEIFPAFSPQTNANSSCARALSILASCPVVSIIASMTSLQTPLYYGWDHSTDCSYRWVYIHTPTTISQEPLPDVLSSMTHASNKTQRDRAVTLKYVLNSLTRKHLDIIKYLLLASNPQIDSIKLGKNSSNHSVTTTTTTTSSSTISSSQGVRWMILLNYCISRLVVKSDTELRELISELKDQRIIKTYSDSDGVVFITLSLSSIEKESIKEYFQKEKKK